MTRSKGRFRNKTKTKRFPLVIESTGEEVNSMLEYLNTNHWKILIENYRLSELNHRCYKCKAISDYTLYQHRTKIRLGKEKLIDIVPICLECFSFDKKSKIKNGKKKNERFALSKFRFNSETLSEGKKSWMLNLHPKERGRYLTSYFKKMTSQYNPSSTWINNQVKQCSKWIRKENLKVVVIDV